MEMLLENQELLDLGTIRAGVQITWQSGWGWLTLAGDYRDHILRPGHQFTCPRRGHVLIIATEPCRLKIEAPQASPRPVAFWQQFICKA